VSALLLGNRHKLELLAALAESGEAGVSLSYLSGRQGVSASVYYPPLRDLISAGLVERVGQRSGDRRCWYRPRESKFWECVRVMVRDLAEVEVVSP
jgi:hypothetical protein